MIMTLTRSQDRWMKMSKSFKEIATKHIGPPVNIEAIIRSMGIELDKKADLESEISGQLERIGAGKYRISANKSDHYLRQRFTMAHELGHFLLHAHLIGDGLDDSRAYRSVADGKFFNENIGPTQETEANRFAARLLMPKSKLAEQATIDKETSQLAKEFQVSRQAMEIRLQSLGYFIENGAICATPD